jgi:TPR repeat protein
MMRQKKIFAYFERGEELEEQGKLDEAAFCYRKAAQEGYAPAARDLAHILDDQDRLEEAEYWYMVAARSGDTWAIFNLAGLLSVRGDEERSRQLYQILADSDDLMAGHACYALGLSYKKQGWQGNAEQWFAKAAARGHEDAKREVDAANREAMRGLLQREDRRRKP